ncbi:MAG TPA: hypothetical protein VJG31_04225 [Candidatus Nanoarchaeia archaeon]|nr:hypothetical protein [Candidatus Nanoarchaeia archaeon]
MALNLSCNSQKKVDLRTIIEQNLDLMLSSEEGSMAKRINAESWGVNAGKDEDGHSQVAVNFLYNPHNGKIRLFENLGSRLQYWDDFYRAGFYREGTFILSPFKGGPLQINEARGVPETPEEARKNILRSIGLYNNQKKIKN